MSQRFGLALSIAVALVVLAWFHGWYAPVAWGWAALVGFWVVILVLLVQAPHELDRAGVALLGALAAVVVWTGASATWSLSAPRTMLEVERGLVYVALVA